MKKEKIIFQQAFGQPVKFNLGHKVLPKLLCMGSCDARNLHRYFQESGQETVNNVYDIFYNPISLEQEFMRVFRGHRHWEQLCYRFYDIKEKSYFYRDPWRSWIKAPSLSELIHLNAQFDNVSRKALTEAKSLLLVLGLAEVWSRIDKPTFPLNRLPIELPLKQIKDEYQSHLAGRKLLHRSLQNISSLTEKYLPEIKTIFLAISPIPLKYSNMIDGMIFSNYINKTVLYQAAQICCQENERVHYFPYYEFIHSIENNPWQLDHRHLKPEAIIAVANLFTRGCLQTKNLSKNQHKRFFVPKVDNTGKIIGKLFSV